ncbi:unnamed protein product [Linum trigynum]|uniref:Homologous recombination OB-fold protein OB-fold domain-containing protein n=1 Tax=Linum trigynum TaxID=586398 RepID=A0AAV2D8Q1_9ROSI
MEGEGWEEALDLDDSDLPPLRPLKRHYITQETPVATAVSLSELQPLPFLRRCSILASQSSQFEPPPSQNSSSRLIPGPAGTVQSAMQRRKDRHNGELVCVGEDPIPTQEYVRRALEDDGAGEDDDFTREPWLCALDFIRSRGLVDNYGAIGIPLSAVKSFDNADRVAQVVAIVKSCTSNGLGDFIVNLKDPTGCIDASIHHRVVSEVESGKDIAVGAVIIIKKVAVFSPSRSLHYLNITPNNLVKIFSKDYKAPLEEDNCALTDVHVPLISDCSDQTSTPKSQSFVSQRERTEGIINSLKQNHNTSGRKHSGEEIEGLSTEAAVSSSAVDGIIGRPKVVTRKEQVPQPGDAMGCGLKEVGVEKDRSDMDEAYVVYEIPDHGNERSGSSSSQVVKQTQHAPPQWTDEQLDELFAFD